MLDQSFSADNFYKIFHLENRKGTFHRELLSKEYLDAHASIKNHLSLRDSLPKNEFEAQLHVLNEKKEEALRKYVQIISEQCNLKSFTFALENYEKDGKTIYTVKKDAPSLFAMKQLQHNIFRTFKVKQANRYDIVKQLRVLLEDGFPKYVIRIDIRKFYESIPQGVLLKKIEENQLLNFQSKKLLKTLIFNYEKNKALGDKDFGIPRGIGVSAYLSELYMRDIDNELKDLPDLVYYGRYVDDAVLVFIPTSKEKLSEYYAQIEKTIQAHGLFLKDGSDGGEIKTLQINLFDKDVRLKFDFLGYKFVIENSKLLKLCLSTNKLIKYQERLQAIVIAYNTNSRFNEKLARKLLINRFKFLTGNFHLLNNKKRIKSGIYYSNRLIKDNKGDFKEFSSLDNLIKKWVSKIEPHPSLIVDVSKLKAKILKRYSFYQGFCNRKLRFHSFDNDNFKAIVSIWKN